MPLNFIGWLLKQLTIIVIKPLTTKRAVGMYGRAKLHETQEVQERIHEHKMFIFGRPSYYLGYQYHERHQIHPRATNLMINQQPKSFISILRQEMLGL